MNTTELDTLRPDVAGAIRDNLGWAWELYHRAGQKWQAIEALREAIDNVCGPMSYDPNLFQQQTAINMIPDLLENPR